MKLNFWCYYIHRYRYSNRNSKFRFNSILPVSDINHFHFSDISKFSTKMHIIHFRICPLENVIHIHNNNGYTNTHTYHHLTRYFSKYLRCNRQCNIATTAATTITRHRQSAKQTNLTFQSKSKRCKDMKYEFNKLTWQYYTLFILVNVFRQRLYLYRNSNFAGGGMWSITILGKRIEFRDREQWARGGERIERRDVRRAVGNKRNLKWKRVPLTENDF